MEVKDFVGKYIVTADIEVKTGLHIGTSKEDLEIGGLDNPVINGSKGRPYIPGSSLKGKMRVLSEFYHGKVSKDGNVHKCTDPNCPVCGLFGTSVDNNSKNTFARTRLIVRDAYLDEKSLEPLSDFLETKWNGTQIRKHDKQGNFKSKSKTTRTCASWSDIQSRIRS